MWRSNHKATEVSEAMGIKKRSAFASAFFVGCLAYYWRLRQRGGSLVSPPYCAWRFVSNMEAWNVAFPDRSSIYHVSLMHLNPGDEIRITGALPLVRYFSYQAYDIPSFQAMSSLRDFEIVPDHGPNLFSNLDAAATRQHQGHYTLYITPHGDKNYTNELRALPNHMDSGFFVLFLRIYDVDGGKHEDWHTVPASSGHDLSCFEPGGQYEKERPEEWGWACPPRVEVRRRHWERADFRALPMCTYRRKQGIKLYNDVTLPVEECTAPENSADNFFLPNPSQLDGKFGNKDAKYLFSCGNVTAPATAGGQELWARVSGILPRTPTSLFQQPLVANVSDYEVRYVSLSSVSRSVPYRGYSTLNDADIVRFYTSRSSSKGVWDRRYVVWVGPADAEAPPHEVKEGAAMLLTWGRSFSGEQIPYPGLLYRQILSRGQVLRSLAAKRAVTHPQEQQQSSDGEPPHQDVRLHYHPSGLADVVPERCTNGSQGEAAACCGPRAPDWCFLPGHVKSRMQHYYPRVDYFLRAPGTNEMSPHNG